VKGKLADYKQLRGGVVYVDELPKNAVGKILRRELRDRAKKRLEGLQRDCEDFLGERRFGALHTPNIRDFFCTSSTTFEGRY
jgi:hypothetical protein